MIQSATATIYVSNLSRAVQFYNQILGLELSGRWGDQYASIDAGRGFTIGLHPAGSKSPEPGARGAIQIGFAVDEPLESAVKGLESRGVVFHGGIVDDSEVRLAYFRDTEGNELHLVEVRKWS